MDEYERVHLADASLDLFAWIISPALEKTLSYGVLVAGIAKSPNLLAFLLGLTTKFENSSFALIKINLIHSSDVMHVHVTWLDFAH